MLFTIEDRNTLLKPLTLTIGIVEKKQTMPILSNVYLKKVGDSIKVIANDMELQASITVQGKMTGEDFSITLPAKKLQDVLKICADNEPVVFSKVGGKIEMISGLAKFTLQSMPADHYPLLKINDDIVCQFSLEQATLRDLIKSIQYAMADRDSRVFLNGMLFEIKAKRLNLVATDAHRLGFVTTQLNEEVRDCSPIIPYKSVVELSKLLEDSPSAITVKVYMNQVCFETANRQLITKIIDGKYPDYERVIPANNDKLCLIRRDVLLKSIERVAVIGIDQLKTVTFALQKNLLVLSCRNEDQEDSRDEVEMDYQLGEELTLNFNIHYVHDLLVNTDADLLQWAFFNNQRSVLVTIAANGNTGSATGVTDTTTESLSASYMDVNNGFKAVIMPLRN